MTWPVTSHQRRRLDWLRTSVDIGWTGPVNLNRRAYLVDGPFDHAALAHACRHVATRHSILRSIYRSDGETWVAQIREQADLGGITVHDAATGHPADIADQLWGSEAPFGPTTSPRFRVHLVPVESSTVLMIVADRLVTDDASMATLTTDLVAAYNSAIIGALTEPPVDNRWWDYVSTEVPSADRGVPLHWLELAGRMATDGAHADVAIPLALPLSEHPDTLEVTTTTVPWPEAPSRTGLVPKPAQVAAIAEPITACTRRPAWIYLYPDLRPSVHAGAIGPYTARTLIQVPGREDRPHVEHMALVSQRYDQAVGPGVAWTELIHDRAGSNHMPPRRPSIAIIDAAPTAAVNLDGTHATELPTRTVDLGPGRIVYEVGKKAMAIHRELGRYPPGLIEALQHAAAAALSDLASAGDRWINRLPPTAEEGGRP